MSEQFVHRTLYTSVSTVSKMVARAGAFVIVAPLIGPANQGTIVLTSAWAATLCLLAAYGLPLRALRLISISPGQAFSILCSDLKCMAALVLPTALLCGLAGAIALQKSDLIVFAIIFFATVFSIVGDYCSSAFRALNNYGTEAAISASTSALHVALLVLAALSFRSVVWLAIAIAASRFLFGLLSVVILMAMPQVRASSRGHIAPIMQTLKESWPYAGDSALSTLLSQIDVLLLGELAPREIVGIYSAGSRLVQTGLVLPPLLMNVMIPSMARAMGSEDFVREGRRLFSILAFCALVGFLSLGLGGPLFTKWVLGVRFMKLDDLWWGFSLLILARFFEAYFGVLMIVAGQQVERVKTQLIACGLIVLGSIAFVPLVGVKGLIASIGISYLAIAATYAFRLLDARIPVGLSKFAILSTAGSIFVFTVATCLS